MVIQYNRIYVLKYTNNRLKNITFSGKDRRKRCFRVTFLLTNIQIELTINHCLRMLWSIRFLFTFQPQ